ncbi:hypothetical protein SAMN05444162_3459 [Paenibacillaceae bacterium GAS479]|nr:hypothetical protein SAMN05444162_3459 [Paenibacillaceae bacterium GAS479]
MAHELYLIQQGKKSNITGLCGNLSWSSSIDTLGEELTFTYAVNDSSHFSKYDIIKLGDQIALVSKGKVLHHYVVIKEDVSGRTSKSYACFDYAWYLNKNKAIIQFKKSSVSSAIGKLCDKVGIKHNIVNIPTLITAIYKEETISDIITEMLEKATQETGSKYYMEMVDTTLTIRKRADLLINPRIRLCDNTPLFPVAAAISNPNKSSSIEEMKNKVVVVSGEDKSTKVYAEISDPSGIKRYGQLTEVITVEKKNAAQARNIAKNTLQQLNQITEDISLTLLGHDDIKAGRSIDINEPVTGVIGRFLIKSANHTVSKGIHKVSVQLGGV